MLTTIFAAKQKVDSHNINVSFDYGKTNYRDGQHMSSAPLTTTYDWNFQSGSMNRTATAELYCSRNRKALDPMYVQVYDISS